MKIMKRTVLYVDKSNRFNENVSDYQIELDIRNIKKKLKKLGVICEKVFFNYDVYMGTSNDSKIMKMIYYMKKEKIDTFVMSSNSKLPLFVPHYNNNDEEIILNYLNKLNIRICDYSSIENFFLKE